MHYGVQMWHQGPDWTDDTCRLVHQLILRGWTRGLLDLWEDGGPEHQLNEYRL